MMQWTDGRARGFTYWSDENIYLGPRKTKTKHSSFSKKHEMILLNASKAVHPWDTNDTLCTALVGTPGAYNMKFVLIRCDSELQVSGIMCIKGGKIQGKIPDITYTLSHWFPLDKTR